MTNRYVIIVAAGKGVRVGGPVPKQFLPLDGKPVLMHTIEAFRGTAKIVLVLGKDNFDYWRELCRQYMHHRPEGHCGQPRRRPVRPVRRELQVLHR